MRDQPTSQNGKAPKRRRRSKQPTSQTTHVAELGGQDNLIAGQPSSQD